jgi:arsenate reductase
MAEAILRHLTRGMAYVASAGTRPQPEIHPMARETVARLFGLNMSGQFPKRVNQFVGRSFDYVITVCDHAAETCPVFPGETKRIHWSFEDPAAGDDADRRQRFERIAREIHERFTEWLSLPDVREQLAQSTTA